MCARGPIVSSPPSAYHRETNKRGKRRHMAFPNRYLNPQPPDPESIVKTNQPRHLLGAPPPTSYFNSSGRCHVALLFRVKNRKGWIVANEMHFCITSVVTDTADCQTQNGSAHGRVFVTCTPIPFPLPPPPPPQKKNRSGSSP